ncbi:MAG: hypothetical protein WD010_06875 [Nitriliruptor sp.]|uniref:hypothetical protein n=1 Tax=Nitriliruptor sp. TaxID=2448056 RepID=UPI0034A00676
MSAVAPPRARQRVAPPARRAQQRPQLRVVQPARPVHTLAYALATIIVLAGAIFGTVTLNALAAGQAVEARQLEARVTEGERAYAQRLVDVAALEDPARIREAAFDLGLVPSGPSRHLALTRALPADGAVTEALPGDAADPLKPVLSANR